MSLTGSDEQTSHIFESGSDEQTSHICESGSEEQTNFTEKSEKLQIRFTKREIKVIELNFGENTILDSEHYAKFVEQYPNLQNDIDFLITKFVSWAKCVYGGCKDLCFRHYIPYRSDHYIDEYAQNEFTGRYDEFEIFMGQIGSTAKKFSLTECINNKLPNDTLRQIANVFNDIGFKTFVAEYNDCGKCFGYKAIRVEYKFTYLTDFVGPIKDNIVDEKHKEIVNYTHICLCLD